MADGAGAWQQRVPEGEAEAAPDASANARFAHTLADAPSPTDERFARHALVPGWRQEVLARACVVVAGAGALGNEVARLLALAGVGRLVLCDPDIVAVSNLSRCPLFRAADVGRLKVDAARRSLRELAAYTVVDARPLPLVNGVGLAELRDATLVVSCLDSRAARLQLAGRANLVRAPLLDGGTFAWGGEVRCYLDPDGPCFGCSLTAAERAADDSAPQRCGDAAPAEQPVGANAPVSSLVGSLLSVVAVRFLLGLPRASGILRVEGGRGTTVAVEHRRDPACPLHVPAEPAERLALSGSSTAGELRRALAAGEVALAWASIQERVECRQCGLAEEQWGVPGSTACRRCGAPADSRTTLELDRAPDSLPLARLGVAPREILGVRSGASLRWVELGAEPPGPAGLDVGALRGGNAGVAPDDRR